MPEPSAAAMLSLRNVRTGYGRATALWDVDLEVYPGEVVVLLGANGAGKTTTMRAISGLRPPWAGSIRFDDREIGGVRPSRIVRYGLSQVAEGRQLFPLLSVEDNLMLGAFSRRDRRSARGDLDATYARWPMLAERRKLLAASLSGGQQQMLAIAQALMARPRMLLLDEPSLGLAPAAVAQVFEVIRELRSDGMTILLVEQMVGRALAVADRGYVLRHGRVALQGTAAALRDDPEIASVYLGGTAAPLEPSDPTNVGREEMHRT